MHTRRSLQFSMFLVVPAALALGWTGTVAADDDDQKFPATGQTTVYRAGDDGDIQAGATLKYKDNKNGTITDRNTRLVWEKKDDNNVGGIHDRDNSYTWDQAFDVHVFTLNNTCAKDENMVCSANAECAGVGGKCGFAGKRDWRVPNIKELQSIVNYQNVIPAVSSAFNTNCVPNATVVTGSCTVPEGHWSSTTNAGFPSSAWLVFFQVGFVNTFDKGTFLQVRAVRGGSR